MTPMMFGMNVWLFGSQQDAKKQQEKHDDPFHSVSSYFKNYYALRRVSLPLVQVVSFLPEVFPIEKE